MKILAFENPCYDLLYCMDILKMGFFWVEPQLGEAKIVTWGQIKRSMWYPNSTISPEI